MNIDQDTFIAWASEHFDDIKISGDEVKVPDIWHHNIDHDNKCWINTKKACFRAFKSERTGHLLELVMEVEGCSWQDAIEEVGAGYSLHGLDEKLDKFLRQEESIQQEEKKEVQLPDNTYLVSSLPKGQVRTWTENYLKRRHLASEKLMVCLSGKYKDRIVIPYYGPKGELLYFNTRALSDKDKLRYLGPDKEEFGVGKGDVLWMSSWPKAKSKVYITEGEFDAMALAQCGFHAGACGGKTISPVQIQMLRPYYVTIAFDSDKAGKDGFKIADELAASAMRNIGIVRPPKGIKDWNALLVQHGQKIVQAYIRAEEQPFNSDTFKKLELEDL